VIAILLLLLRPATPAAAPMSITLQPTGGETFTAVLTGPAPAGAPHGDFGGTISVNDSPATMPASGRTELAQGRLKLHLILRWADVPSDWVDRFKPEGFGYRVRGRIGGREELDWSGSLRWNEVEVQGGRDIASHYLRLASLTMTRFSLVESEALATLRVRNPFSFPIKLAGAEYALAAGDRDVGRGQFKGTLLRASRESDLSLPVELDHGQLLAAAGGAIASGGEVQGRLVGKLVVRLPGGDIDVPLDLSSRLSLSSE